MAVGEPQDVTCNGRPLRLVDVPGICDNSGGDGAEGDDVMDHNLRTLRNRLNDGHAYVIFFVVTPRNGRIDNSDLALMRLFLEKFERGPLVGLILTQIRKRDMTSVDNPTFVEGVMKVLSHGGANLRSLSTHRALVLKDHEEEFSDAEIQNIREYILSFEPTQVRIHNMVSGAWRTLLQFFKRLVS
ncbi:hypothetical protein BGZ83_011930 [Gryganskiella cystojenkinii]|nr:hypothetical protein BGZ83_011930 [Gryganskiella cystojenkinii]